METGYDDTMYDEHAMFDELAAGHALHALDEIEAEVFAAHLQGCVRCEEAVRELSATAGELAYAAYDSQAPEPPASLLHRIRAEVAGTPQQRDELSQRRASRQRFARTGAALSAAAGVALVVSLISTNSTLRTERDQQVAWSGELTQAVKQLEHPGTAKVALTSGEGVAGVALITEGKAALVVDDLEPNDAASTYVLWKIEMHGEPQAVATFDVEGRDLEVVDEIAMGSYDPMTTLAVTREAGRKPPPRPQTPIIASGRIGG